MAKGLDNTYTCIHSPPNSPPVQAATKHWAVFPVLYNGSLLIVVVQLLSHVWLFVTPWTAACQTSLSLTISWSLLRLMSIVLMMPSNKFILCCPLLLPSVFPSIRVFSSELAFCSGWPKYWNFSFSISPSKEYSGLISFRMDWFDLLAVQGILKSLSNNTVQKHQFFGARLSL